MQAINYQFVYVAINRPLFKEFIYKVVADSSDVLVGKRVLVNFANSKQVGLITRTEPNIDTSLDLSQIKVAQLLDNRPIIPSEVMKVLEFGSNYYHYPLGQCINVALPKILRDGGTFAYENIPALRLTGTVGADVLNKIKSKEQKQILEILKAGGVRRKELRERGISSNSENALVKKGLVELYNFNDAQVKDCETQYTEVLKEEPPKPNIEQLNAITTISACNHFDTFLLNGITGSGKTEVYLQIIQNILEQGKAVLILVPEISLTPQTFDRFYRRFKVPVSSMHSALSDRERLDSYMDMSLGKSRILIGTRTALFTPIPNLGLIVLDEEHDSSFKQSDSFRYHARNLAIIRAKINNCPIVLGSATPSLESIYNVQIGLYKKLDLTIRAKGATLPKIELIDLRNEPLTDGLKTGICQSLENEIGEETAKGNQVLLFLNRRGYSHHLVCHQCGHVFVCPNCDNLLTVHKQNHRLQCHVCENVFSIPDKCYVCGNTELIEEGFGTEQVYEFLKTRYPDVGIERIDRDSVTTKTQLETKLSRIREGKSQIMLGTQMLAKGHDFPNVTLVGILDVDSSLFNDDYRSLENSAQLITQVAGRAGRGNKVGRVIIQTHHPDNKLINQLADPNCSYLTIANDLLDTRKKLNLPPYTSQAFLLCNSANRFKAFNFIKDIYEKINIEVSNFGNLSISSVTSDKMEKVQNRYHFHVLINSYSRKTLSQFLLVVQQIVIQSKIPNDVRFAIEVDPINMY